MKRKLFIYIIWSFGVLLLGTQPAIGAETLSKKIGLRAKTIMIDPWYSGKERGPLIAQKYGKDITLEIAQKLRGLLETAGFKVYLTRSEDQIVPLENRLFQGKSKGADVHFAIKVSKTKKDCIRIFVASPPVKETPKEPESRKLEELNDQLGEILRNLQAASIREDSLSLAGTIRNKLKQGSAFTCIELWKGKDYILENAQMPTVIVDFPISSSSKQQEFLTDDVSLNKIAQSLADSIKTYSDERTTKDENVL